MVAESAIFADYGGESAGDAKRETQSQQTVNDDDDEASHPSSLQPPHYERPRIHVPQ